MLKSQIYLLKKVLLICVAFSVTSSAAQEDNNHGLHNQSTDAAFAEVTRQIGINEGKDAFGAALLNIGPFSIQNICVIAANKEDKAASDEYAKLGESLVPHDLLKVYTAKRARFDPKAKFKKIFKDVDEAVEYLSDREDLIDWNSINRPPPVLCNVLVSTIADLAKLARRSEGSSQLKAMTGIGVVLERIELLNKIAIRDGYRDYADYSFWERGAMSRYRALLIEHGVADEKTLQTAYSDMRSDGYDEGNNVETLVQYLTDRSNAKLNKVSVLAQRNSRLAEEKRVAERKAAEEKKQLAEYAKNYPYRAVFSCTTPGGNNYVLACFTGNRATGNSEIRVTVGNTSKIIGPLDMAVSPQNLPEGFEIDLPKRFSLYAQNVAEYLKLGVKISERLSGRVIYSNEVSQFGVIRASK